MNGEKASVVSVVRLVILVSMVQKEMQEFLVLMEELSTEDQEARERRESQHPTEHSQDHVVMPEVVGLMDYLVSLEDEDQKDDEESTAELPVHLVYQERSALLVFQDVPVNLVCSDYQEDPVREEIQAILDRKEKAVIWAHLDLRVKLELMDQLDL